MTTKQMDQLDQLDRNRIQVSHSASIQVGSSITLGDLRRLCETEGVPDNARVTIDMYAGDFREPGYTTIKLNW